VRLPQRFVGVLAIQRIGTCIEHVRIAVVQRLAATADTAAGTSHDFNYMILVVPVADVLQQMACIAQTVGDAYFQFKAVQVDGGAAYTGESAHLLKVYIIQRPSRIDFVDGAQDCLHHAAGSAEDNACTR